jgi:hypothetical protein
VRTPDDDDPEMNDQVGHLGGGDFDGGLADLMLSAANPQTTGLEGVLLEMHDLGRMYVPHPSPELETLLTKGLPNLRQQRLRARRRRAVVGTVLVGSITMSLTGIAAANDRLPGGSQSVIAGVINGITPFHIQDRRTRPVVPRVPEQAPERPAPTHPRPSGEPSGDRGSESPEPGETDPTQPAPTPTPTPGERESEPRSSPASPRESSESEREGGG